MNVREHTHTQFIQTLTYKCMHIHTHTQFIQNTHTRTHTYMHTHTDTHQLIQCSYGQSGAVWRELGGHPSMLKCGERIKHLTVVAHFIQHVHPQQLAGGVLEQCSQVLQTRNCYFFTLWSSYLEQLPQRCLVCVCVVWCGVVCVCVRVCVCALNIKPLTNLVFKKQLRCAHVLQNVQQSEDQWTKLKTLG